jgi:hypothetical protein
MDMNELKLCQSGVILDLAIKSALNEVIELDSDFDSDIVQIFDSESESESEDDGLSLFPQNRERQLRDRRFAEERHVDDRLTEIRDYIRSVRLLDHVKLRKRRRRWRRVARDADVVPVIAHIRQGRPVVWHTRRYPILRH